MREIKVKVENLLEILKGNRQAHRAIFVEALEGYRKEAIELLEKAVADAKAGKKVNTFIALEEPIDQTKDYDRAIGMLEMCVDEEITINDREYSQYVMDDWSWKGQFMATNTKYLLGGEGNSVL